MTEAPLPSSVTGSVPRTDGSLPPQMPAEHSETVTLLLAPAERSLAEAIRARAISEFSGMDPFTPTTGGYNHNVDMHGRDTLATRFQDGFLATSIERGADLGGGDSEDTSYRLHKVLLGDPEGYQRAVLKFDDFKSGKRIRYMKYANRDSGIVSKEVKDPEEIEAAVRNLGILH